MMLMAILYIIIAILAGAAIMLYIHSSEKTKKLEKEIIRLRKLIASGGLDFEQIEHRIVSLKEEINLKKKIIGNNKMTGTDMEKYLEEIDSRVDRIIGELLSDKTTK